MEGTVEVGVGLEIASKRCCFVTYVTTLLQSAGRPPVLKGRSSCRAPWSAALSRGLLDAISHVQAVRPCMATNGKTVLLVEDNEDNRIVYSTILRHFGYEVSEALNGEEGIAKARSERPDLILMDISIPI